MPVTNGTRLGVYEVVAKLGEGGMGEVYRAQDTKLGRAVAIKVLPDAVASDPERIGRFEREAKVLASLNHPNIAGLFGMEQSGDRVFLVMELVDGETLAERIAAAHASGGFAPADLLMIAIQIAEGVESAHERGIVHRDLKPANIKMASDGRVKVLDFGLARALAGEPAESGLTGLTHSPTLSLMATQAGMILGTAAYMSPEQAKGLQADHRSDVFSFGVVLYEMVTGRQPFQGETAPDILASVLARDPDLDAIAGSVDPRLRDLIARCLQKSPRRRWQAIGDVRIELETIATQPRPQPQALPAPVEPARPLWKRAFPIVATAVVVSAAMTGAWFWLRPPASAPVTRFTYRLPANQFMPITQRALMALSPDGSQLVYPAAASLHIRTFSEFESRSLAGTDLSGAGATGEPVFSPDGRWVAFFTSVDQTIKKVPIAGGPAMTICRTSQTPMGVSWSGDTIVFSTSEGVMRVAANGGTPERIMALTDANEVMLGARLLPGGEAMLVTVGPARQGLRWDRAQIVAVSLKTGERKVVVNGGTDGQYVRSGHLVYAQGGALFAVPFDPKRLVTHGEPTAVVEGVARGAGVLSSGFAHYAVSSTGTLAYVPGPSNADSARAAYDFVMQDRSGSVERLKIPPGPLSHPRVSPDGKRIVFAIDDQKESNVWLYDLDGTAAMRRLTFAGRDRNPIWSADGQRVTFQSDRDTDSGIYWVSADGGTPERLTKPEPGEMHVPHSWSPAGDLLLFDVIRGSNVTLWSFSRGDKTISQFGDVASTVPTSALFSPDGRWVAYATSNPSGGLDTLFVQPFPPNGQKYQISRSDVDGHHPLWSPDGKELFFIPGLGQFTGVTIGLRPSFTVGNPIAVPRRFSYENAPANVRGFDVTPDGKRFIGIAAAASSDQANAAANSEIRVVVNWFTELQQRAPVR